jgi:hypothetical protein
LKRILSGILTILDHKEKIKLTKLILSDLVMGMLDVGFLFMVLVVINFYTSNQSASTISFLPAAFTNKNSLLLISIFVVLFGLKNGLGYLNTKWQNRFFYGIASRLSKRNIQNYLKDDYLRFVNIDSSVLIRRISQQPIEFSHYILINFQQVISQSILIL